MTTSSVWGAEVENALLSGQSFAPLQEHSLILTAAGPVPAHLVIFEGEKLRLFVATTLAQGSCLSIPQKKIFLDVRPGDGGGARNCCFGCGKLQLFLSRHGRS